MRSPLAFAVLLLPLAGCVVAPAGPYYARPVAPAPVAVIYPGYSYNDGSPTLIVEGVTFPLIFYGGGWGYWDRFHRWHRAPEAVWNHLMRLHPGGAGYRPWRGGPFAGGRGGRVAAPARAYAPAPRRDGGRAPAVQRRQQHER